MSPREIVARCAFLLAVLAAITMAATTPSVADGQLCSWVVVSELPPGCSEPDPDTCQPRVYLEVVNCDSFEGNPTCDAACDWEYFYCTEDCNSDPETLPTACSLACRPAYIACIGACIPSI